MAPLAKRIRAWQRLADQLDRSKLMKLTTTIGLEKVIGTARDVVEGKVRGRVVVEVA